LAITCGHAAITLAGPPLLAGTRELDQDIGEKSLKVTRTSACDQSTLLRIGLHRLQAPQVVGELVADITNPRNDVLGVITRKPIPMISSTIAIQRMPITHLRHIIPAISGIIALASLITTVGHHRGAVALPVDPRVAVGPAIMGVARCGATDRDGQPGVGVDHDLHIAEYQ
jgi:hypothetical protein